MTGNGWIFSANAGLQADMARQTTIKGLGSLDRKLKRMPVVARETIRAEMGKAADEIVAMMKRLVPQPTGALRDSIGWTWGQAPRGSVVVAAAKGQGVGGDLTITIYAGSKDAFYARWVEFGTTKMSARPYFYVSWRAGAKKAKRKVRAGIRKAAKKVASGG